MSMTRRKSGVMWLDLATEDRRRSDRERLPTTEDLGLTRKDIYEARLVRDAEAMKSLYETPLPAQSQVRSKPSV
jgi:hypothetical protein